MILVGSPPTKSAGLNSLRGEYAGFHAVWVTGNWRIIFRFVDGDAYDLDHLDYT